MDLSKVDWNLAYNPNRTSEDHTPLSMGRGIRPSSDVAEPPAKKLKISDEIINESKARLLRAYIEDKLNRGSRITLSEILDYAKEMDPRTSDNDSNGDESDELESIEEKSGDDEEVSDGDDDQTDEVAGEESESGGEEDETNEVAEEESETAEEEDDTDRAAEEEEESDDEEEDDGPDAFGEVESDGNDGDSTDPDDCTSGDDRPVPPDLLNMISEVLDKVVKKKLELSFDFFYQLIQNMNV
jgi:hypothetical protein